MPYVFSTLSASMDYAFYNPSTNNDLPREERRIRIEGGANVTNKKLVTPKGVATGVNDEDLALLETHPVFKQHVENGFIKVERDRHNAEKVARDMEPKDKSAQKTEADFVNQGLKVKKDTAPAKAAG